MMPGSPRRPRIQRLERLVKRRSLQKPVDRLWGLWSALWDAWWTRHLAGTPDYSFTTDYVARHVEVWSEHLAPLRSARGASLLEIGSFEGRSALWFLDHILTHPSATIICVDPFIGPGVEARFDHNIKLSGHAAKVTKIKGQSEAVLPGLMPASHDAIYVDGAHLAVNALMDAALSWKLLKHGGVLIFDDYAWAADRSPWRRPQMGVDLFLDLVGSDAIVLDKGAQVIVRKVGPLA